MNMMNPNNHQNLPIESSLLDIEEDPSVDDILDPFDPRLISIDQKVVAMDTLMRRLKQGSINLIPNFQRNEVWDLTRRSRLIESIMLKIPLPMFYVAADKDGRWEVVDGLQRLSTIRNFILGNKDKQFLVLQDLEFLGKLFNTKAFADIEDNPQQQRIINTIMETELRFTVINPGTPEAVKRNIFKRINTGGMPLTAQEIRHALYQGHISILLKELVESDEFKMAIPNGMNDQRMAARELILYFLAFLIFPRNRYKLGLDAWLSNTMRVINSMPEFNKKILLNIYPDGNIPDFQCNNIEEIKTYFKLAMQRCTTLFGEHAFRKSLPGDSRKTPINKALFEVWSNLLCQLSETEFQILVKNKNILLKKYQILLRGDVILTKADINLPLPEPQERKIIEDYLKENPKIHQLNITDLVAYRSQLQENEKLYLNKYLTLLEGKILDDVISKHVAIPESVTSRYNLIKNMINIILKDHSTND